ncbi:MAG: cation transport regulator ChaB [Leptolyngbyaceae cyanobacterium SL_7_1]|nr:cation transport regulator ChaB [Leptolyngbyaceae cyanobacterium SL_7_1]
MAFQSVDHLPQDAKELPEGAQQIFMTAFNSAESDGLSESGAMQVAWSSVTAEYERSESGEWKHKPDAKADRGPLGSMQSS